MIQQDLQNALNQQINQEFTAAYNYLAMAAYFDTQNLDGFANWMQLQHDEEQVHGMKLLRYLQDRGGEVLLEGIESPRREYSSPLEVFQVSLERGVLQFHVKNDETEEINVIEATEESDIEVVTETTGLAA